MTHFTKRTTEDIMICFQIIRLAKNGHSLSFKGISA